MKKILEVEEVDLVICRDNQRVNLLQEMNFSLFEGERLGIVGDSGSGKTLLMKMILQLLPKSVKVTRGKVLYRNKNLLQLSAKEMRKIRGREIGMIFQNPLSFLNPTMKIGIQIGESYRAASPYAGTKEVKTRVLHLLNLVGIDDPELRFYQYPHLLSGGMRQRVLIALALISDPSLVIADEPTTALDTTIQAQIFDIFYQLHKSIILISHDLSLVASFCDRLLIMHEGQIVEEGSPKQLLTKANHPHTQKLIYLLSSLQEKQAVGRVAKLTEHPIISASNFKKHFSTSRGILKAVDGVSLEIPRGMTLGLVGESGSGKSTLGQGLLHLCSPTSGSIYFNGIDLSSLSSKELKRWRKKAQIIFQDPHASLNHRMKILEIIMEPLLIHNIAVNFSKITKILELVGLNQEHLHQYPYELSGGQKQRVAIARALILNPHFIVCDEPVASLDLSSQLQITQLLKTLQRESQISYLFISHDLRMIRHIADFIAVLYLGKIVESGPTQIVCDNPLHPYTQALISAIPQLTLSRKTLQTSRFKKEILTPTHLSRKTTLFSCISKKNPVRQHSPPNDKERHPEHYVALPNQEAR